MKRKFDFFLLGTTTGIVLMLLFLPVMSLVSIWCINTLFGLTIQFTFKNIFAMFLLLFMFGNKGGKAK